MSDYVFSDAERWAVFSIHGDSCYVCRRPLDLFTMEIDHVLPESLLKKTDLFDQHKKQLGLPDSFCINGFENWLPICNGCNKAKSDKVFQPSLLIQGQLERAQAKAQKAHEVAGEVPRQRQIARALGVLSRGLAGTQEEWEMLLPLVRRFAEIHPEAMALVRSSSESNRGTKYSLEYSLRRSVVAPLLRLAPNLTATFLPGAIHMEMQVGNQKKAIRYKFFNS